MRHSVKIFIGLSMPVLALTAVWLWSLSKAKGTRNKKNEKPRIHNHEQDFNREHELLLAPSDVKREHASVPLTVASGNNNIGSNDEKLHKCESLPDSLGSSNLSDKSSDASTSEPSDEQLFQASQEEHVVEGEGEETWEIEFPQALCGRLIGKKGKNVQRISQETGTKIRLIPQKDNTESSQRLVSITGTPDQLGSALNAMQDKFPSVPFKRLNGTTTGIESTAQCVGLPEQGMFQVFVTNIIDANHFYVQLHDQLQTVQAMLQQQDQQMYQFYCSNQSTGILAGSVSTGMVCAAYCQSGWWRRAQVVGLLMKPDEVEITWLDYGGKDIVHISTLRHLRQECLQLPFQAVECYLSNVIPHQGESSFSMTACALFEGLTQSSILTARITSYNRECPCLELYAPHCQWTGQPILINRELVRRGYARWSET